MLYTKAVFYYATNFVVMYDKGVENESLICSFYYTHHNQQSFYLTYCGLCLFPNSM